MRCSSARGYLFLTGALALALFAVSLPTAWADSDLPVLWQGEVRTSAGVPAAGTTVIAYARPPAIGLEPGRKLAEVARTTTDASGRFVLRAAPNASLQTAADDDGWVSVMVTAISADGMAMAVDSVAWGASPGFSARSVGAPNGRWLTTPAEREAALQPGDFRATSAAYAADVAKERPSVLVLAKGKPDLEAPRFSAMSSSSRWGCGVYKKEDAGISPVAIGELFLEQSWGGEFVYNNTRSTSFQVGLSEDGKYWGVGGSTTFSRQSQAQSGGPIGSTAEFQRFRYSADMVFKRITWICGEEGYYYSEQTIEPVDWNLGMHQDHVSLVPSCNPRFHSTVPGGRYLLRAGGSSITLQGAINIGGFAGSMTSVVSRNVSYRWDNAAPYQRDVCGESRMLNQNTRAVTVA
jgi:hypothetical protein